MQIQPAGESTNPIAATANQLVVVLFCRFSSTKKLIYHSVLVLHNAADLLDKQPVVRITVHGEGRHENECRSKCFDEGVRENELREARLGCLP